MGWRDEHATLVNGMKFYLYAYVIKMSTYSDDESTVVSISTKRQTSDISVNSNKTKRQRQGEESESEDFLDEEYAATLDISDIHSLIVTRGGLGGGQRKIVVDDDDDDDIGDVVAEVPGNNHHRVPGVAVQEFKNFAAPKEIVPVNGMEQVSIIGDMLLGEAMKGRTELAEAVVKLRDLPHTAWMDRRMKNFPAAVIKSIVSMLCTISSRLIYHLAVGDVPRARLVERKIYNELHRMKAKGDAQPGIYANFVVDGHGWGPSPNDWKVVLGVIKKYMRNDGPQSHAYAERIDTIYGDAEDNAPFANARKYLSTNASLENGLFASPQRLATIESFVAAMEMRIRNAPQRGKPMERPLCEVGYSSQPHTRLQAHKLQHSSNYIMGLCIAIMDDEFPFDGFRLSQHIILQIYQEQDAALGETFVSALMQAYTVNGGGFSHAAAGLSIDSINRVSDTDRKKFRLALAENEAYLRRMLNETARLTTLTKEMEIKDGLREIEQEKAKQDEMWEEIARIAPEVQQRAQADIDVIQRMREAFL
ncbi:hypothetical protein V494_04031 [Pseudogymnoascus sp. VKM F-4513 (FW-928)]|nr:hypothetical protein V494_04031 [Pseudogymnoascus sp. VKM F-4513 (FW-928)]